MRQRYLEGPALLADCASGRGAIVIVEGEFYEDDAYFYGRWFGEQAREVSFFPQNGWKRVVDAVAELRQALPHRQVFGIVDRDFADEALIAQQALQTPPDGIFRTQLYTLENYLLSPAGWLQVVRLLGRGGLPAGWQTVEDVQARIEDAYRQCMRLAAFNYTVRQECDRQPGDGIEYKQHPKGLIEPEVKLLQWGEARRAPLGLEQAYQQNCARIHALPAAQWPVWITGKAVLKVFLEGFAIRSVPSEMLLNLYINSSPVAPDDLAAIITRIIQHRGAPKPGADER